MAMISMRWLSSQRIAVVGVLGGGPDVAVVVVGGAVVVVVGVVAVVVGVVVVVVVLTVVGVVVTVVGGGVEGKEKRRIL